MVCFIWCKSGRRPRLVSNYRTAASWQRHARWSNFISRPRSFLPHFDQHLYICVRMFESHSVNELDEPNSGLAFSLFTLLSPWVDILAHALKRKIREYQRAGDWSLSSFIQGVFWCRMNLLSIFIHWGTTQNIEWDRRPSSVKHEWETSAIIFDHGLFSHEGGGLIDFESFLHGREWKNTMGTFFINYEQRLHSSQTTYQSPSGYDQPNWTWSEGN